MEIWVYGNDRESMTPHCHIFDKTQEIEVSLIDWSIINVKNGAKAEWSNFTEFRDRFFKWLYLPNEENGSYNYISLFSLWNHANEDNTLVSFIKSHNNINISRELENFISTRQKYLQNIYKQVTNALFAVYYMSNKTFKFKTYTPIELFRKLDLDIVIDEEDEEALNAIANAEEFVYKTVYKN